MAEIRIKNAPEELKQLLTAEAKRLGMDVRAVMLFRLWGSGSAPHEGVSQAPDGVRKGSPQAPRFVPPTLAEVVAYCGERKSRVDPRQFWNHYEANGWMAGKVRMRNWRAAVGKWETNEKAGTFNFSGGNGHGGEGRQLSASEARSERIKRNVLEGIAAANRDRDVPDGREREVRTPKRVGD